MAAEDHKVGFEATTSSIKDMFTTLNAAYDGKRDRKALIIASDRGEGKLDRLRALAISRPSGCHATAPRANFDFAGFRVSVANQERSMYAVAYLDVRVVCARVLFEMLPAARPGPRVG